jgi:hypothetical protein
MFRIRRLIAQLGVEGLFLGALGLAALVVSIASLVGVQLKPEVLLATVVGALGLLMEAMVVQVAHRKADIEQLRAALGLSEVEILDMKTAFPRHLADSALGATDFILDSEMSKQTPSRRTEVQHEYQRIRDERVLKGELDFKRIEVIYNQRSLESIVGKLLALEGREFLIRHYDPPPKAIPILSMMSFDDKRFYLGGFHTGEAPGIAQVVYVRDEKVAQLLREYWRVLWQEATPLNAGGQIDWTELKRIAKRIQMSEQEFEAMVTRLRDEVQRKKRSGAAKE